MANAIIILVLLAFRLGPSLPQETTKAAAASEFFRRGGGIDVGTHSKRNRTYSIVDAYESSKARLSLPTPPTPPKDDAAPPQSKAKPALRVGIVLPRQIFQQRRYQAAISKSLAAVARADGGEDGDGASLLERVRRVYDFSWSASTFRLADGDDSVNFGDLSISPPPSGQLELSQYT